MLILKNNLKNKLCIQGQPGSIKCDKIQDIRIKRTYIRFCLGGL